MRADACADTRHKNAGVACQNYQWHAPMYQVQHLQGPAPCHAVTFHITSACRRKGARTEKMQTCTPISVSKSHNQERARRQIWSMRSQSDRSSPRPRLPPAFSFSLSLSLYLPCLWTRGSGHCGHHQLSPILHLEQSSADERQSGISPAWTNHVKC